MALQMGHLRAKMPAMFGKEKAQKKLLANLTENFVQVRHIVFAQYMLF